jgi:hypothetical protein
MQDAEASATSRIQSIISSSSSSFPLRALLSGPSFSHYGQVTTPSHYGPAHSSPHYGYSPTSAGSHPHADPVILSLDQGVVFFFFLAQVHTHFTKFLYCTQKIKIVPSEFSFYFDNLDLLLRKFLL